MTSDVGTVLAAIDQESRRAQVRGIDDIDGIDFVELLSNHAGSSDYVSGAPQQRTLLVRLVNGPVPSGWTAEHTEVLEQDLSTHKDEHSAAEQLRAGFVLEAERMADLDADARQDKGRRADKADAPACQIRFQHIRNVKAASPDGARAD